MSEDVPFRSDLPEEDHKFYSQILTSITRRMRGQIAENPDQRTEILAGLTTFTKQLSDYVEGELAEIAEQKSEEWSFRADDHLSSVDPDDTVRMFRDFVHVEDWESVGTPSIEVHTLRVLAPTPDRRPLDLAVGSSFGPRPWSYDDLDLFETGDTPEPGTMNPQQLSNIPHNHIVEPLTDRPGSEDEATGTLDVAMMGTLGKSRLHGGKPCTADKRDTSRVTKGVRIRHNRKPRMAVENQSRAHFLSCYMDKSLTLTTENAPVEYRLLAGVGSGFAFRQLQLTLKAFRQRDLVLPPLLSSSTAQIFQGIAHSDRSSVTSSFLHRFFLYRLSQQRDSLCQKIQERRKLKLSRKSASSDKGPTAAIAIDELVQEINSNGIDRITVKNWLQSASKWASAGERYSIGILALIPIGGPYKISNSCVEGVDFDSFRHFLDMLEKYRGSFIREASARLTSNLFPILEGKNAMVLHLENTAPEIFTKEPVDSSVLLHLCQLA